VRLPKHQDQLQVSLLFRYKVVIPMAPVLAASQSGAMPSRTNSSQIWHTVVVAY